MAQHADEDHHGHAPAHGHAHDPEVDERMNREILADREWIFSKFVQFTAWNVVLIFVVLVLLALTQT